MIRITKERDNPYSFPRGELIPPGKVHIGNSIKKERKQLRKLIEAELDEIYEDLPTNIQINI